MMSTNGREKDERRFYQSIIRQNDPLSRLLPFGSKENSSDDKEK